jgi:2-keto-4-pentenoate hydratase/2-oxohepta-3-ene-1,7-dioic acid hydratase in catechol pathway
MKLLRYFDHDSAYVKLGLVDEEKILDVTEVTGLTDPTELFWLKDEKAILGIIRKNASVVEKEKIKLRCPIKRCTKFIIVGLNYRAHAKEMQMEQPKEPLCSNKQTSCLSFCDQPILLPLGVNTLDYEGEIAVVIGRQCRNVEVSEVRNYILGITAANDISVRQWQFVSPTWTLGKSYDTHGPIGPTVVTLDEIPSLDNLSLRTYVNGELRQMAQASDMIFSIFDVVSYVSKRTTLLPGDIIATGTPPGVGNSFDPPKYLNIGDEVKVELDVVGTLCNYVVSEQDNTKAVIRIDHPGW